MTLPKLESDRLILRALRLDDAEALHAAFSDDELMTWWSSGPHKTLEETKTYVAENCEGGRWPTWVITDESDVAKGWVVLHSHRENVNEIGYILAREHWGSGIAHEAVSRVIEHGFKEQGLRRIFADVDPDNGASIGLLEKLGFQREGLLRGEWETHIGVRDSYIYGLLRDEWTS